MDEEKEQLLRTLGLSIIDNDRRKEVKVQHMTRSKKNYWDDYVCPNKRTPVELN